VSFSRSLQRLLRLRQSLERQEELKMALASARLQAARTEQSQQQAQERARQETLRADLHQGTAGAELQSAGLRQTVEQQRRQRLREQAVAAQSEQMAQRAVLLEARRGRETLATLAARFHEARERERTRREQAAQDEAYLLRRPDRHPED
jgi:flagellar biosynthesis chaperone FliJ